MSKFFERDKAVKKLVPNHEEEVQILLDEIARMRPVFRAAIGVCVTGKSTMAQLITVCVRAERKAKGK